MEDKQPQRRIPQHRLHRANMVFFIVTIVMGVANVTYLIVTDGHPWEEIVFRGLQYVGMILILRLPEVLKMRFKVEVPWLLSTVIVVFCFSSLVLGDGLDFYGRFPWWDSFLHALSGVMLSMIALWLIHIIMAENERYIYLNKYFLSLFLVLFSLGMGACWEIIEYTYDSLMGTNTQQFMASTSSSIITAQDIPLCGHDALKDTMVDLMLDLAGALIVAIYGFVKHQALLDRYGELWKWWSEEATDNL